MKDFYSIAIDGPSGAGKSTMARKLAADFGFIYVDTGAIYRTVGLAAYRAGIDRHDEPAVKALLPKLSIEMRYNEAGEQRMFLDGEDVSEAIRMPEISICASDVSSLPAVRSFLLEMQRKLAREHNVVMDGRDIGTVVLPDADLKIFLTASAEQRAKRRMLELEAKGVDASFDESRGVCFSTYAVPVILGEIKKLFRDGGTVKVSRSLKELSLRINAAREHHCKLCGVEPTLSQLAEELGESVENITLAIQAAQPAVSLTPENREESDRQMDIPVESPEEELADKIGLAEVLKGLPEEDRRIIQLRFYGGKTQSDTAKLLHTTQVQISRRERKILKVMRDRLLDE